MKFIKAYLFQILFVLGIITVMSVAFRGTSIKENDADRKSFGDGWTCMSGGEEKYYDVLPDKLDMGESDTIVLTKSLPDNLDNYNAISFFSTHDNVDVYADGNLIYELRTDAGSKSKTPGNCWNLVELNDEYAGKMISIVLEPAYNTGSVNIPGIYIGSALNMFRAKIADAILPIIISSLMLLFGIFVMIMSTCCRKKLNLSIKMFWLGLFASLLSVWSVLETHIASMIFGHTLLFSQMTFLALKLALIPLVCFVAYIYDQENKKIVNILCVASFFDITATCVLQFLGIFDFRETIFVTHFLCVVAALSIIIHTVRSLDVINALNAKRKKMILINSACLALLCVTTLSDIVRYYMFNSLDSAKYGRIGLLIYIGTLAVYIVYDSFELIDDGREVENIKEIALVDGLTKVKNRNAYQQEISAIHNDDFPRMGIIMFDLNNLKYFNDVYGHSVGDYYIIICSEIIMDIFSRFGEVYRIGGDEFCAVVKDMSEEEFASYQTDMSKRVNGLNVQFIENRMAIASGYAKFDAESDVNLIETAQRADKQMYDKKAKMKMNANQRAN